MARDTCAVKIHEIKGLTPAERAELSRVVDQYYFHASDYYLSLIDWDDPDDPIRRVVIPSLEELEEWGKLDASEEEKYTIMPGLQHKYASTAVLLVSNACGGICRYCFRKRIFLKAHVELLQDVPAAMEYIRQHREITNVLLTGGDALMLPTSSLENIVKQLREIDHVHIIRLGTKLLSYDVYRVLDDPTLPEMIRAYSTDTKKIYVMCHFNHPREVTDLAVKAINILGDARAILFNQTPLVRGVNDNPKTLAALLNKLSFVGVRPYYIFQCRPAVGNKPYAVPIEEAYEVVERAKSLVSGLAKCVRYVMSHASGKIEIVGKTEGHVYFKYHRAARREESCRFIVARSNPQAYWFDDYRELVNDQKLADIPDQ